MAFATTVLMLERSLQTHAGMDKATGTDMVRVRVMDVEIVAEDNHCGVKRAQIILVDVFCKMKF